MTTRAQANRASEAPAGAPHDAVLARLVGEVRTGRSIGGMPPLPGPIHVTLRDHGRACATFWQPDGQIGAALAAAVTLAGREGADTLQVDLGDAPERVAPKDLRSAFPNAARGILGLGVALDGTTTWFAPSQMIATNRSFLRAVELELARRGIDAGTFAARGGYFLRFRARQILIRLAPEVEVLTLLRGGRLVRPEACTPSMIRDMIEGMAGWMRANLHGDGQMTYKYWPSRGEESSADNTIRQFMATLCLIRIAARTGRAGDLERAEANLGRNLDRFYRPAGEIGTIAFGGSAKLGAAALAALAILEAPFGVRFQKVLERLEAGVMALRQPDGSFRTFHEPAERNDNQNFYPGEALLFLAERLRRRPDPALLVQCLESARWYQSWHLRNRNPAFIPWHSQAAARLLEIAGEAWLRDWVFEMNDWLALFQQWDRAPCPDLAGRFYDPSRPGLGPPHASSTGVYLEGLADALALAEAAGDEARAALYRRTVWRGIRSLRQLQFKDEVDLFYVRNRERVQGGVRTEAYDNTIRVDNVQHGLMALLKLERMAGFASA